MTQETKICVFSLSERDIFRDMEHAINWLKDKGENPYLFRKMKPVDGLPSGSIVLFSFEAQIFGKATVKEDVEKLSLEEKQQYGSDYEHKMILNPSIEIFPQYPEKKDVAPKIGKKFGQVFTYLNWKQYQQILEMARKT